MKTFFSMMTLGLAMATGCAFAATHAGAASGDAGCEAKAAEKKLAGAAKTSFVKKCEKDAMAAGPGAACEKSAADKKLAGAAKTSHIKKCMADGAKPAAAAEAKPAAAAPAVAAAPAAAAKPAASGAKK